MKKRMPKPGEIVRFVPTMHTIGYYPFANDNAGKDFKIKEAYKLSEEKWSVWLEGAEEDPVHSCEEIVTFDKENEFFLKYYDLFLKCTSAMTLVSGIGLDYTLRKRTVPKAHEIGKAEKMVKAILDEINNLKVSNEEQKEVKHLLEKVCNHLLAAIDITKKYQLERKIVSADEPQITVQFRRVIEVLRKAEEIAYKEAGLK